MVVAYQRGVAINELASQLEIGRSTVLDHISRSMVWLVEEVQRFLNPLSDPETRQDLERLHSAVAGQGASWLISGPGLPTARQRQVHLSAGDQLTLVSRYSPARLFAT
jgi:hypothetical protein